MQSPVSAYKRRGSFPKVRLVGRGGAMSAVQSALCGPGKYVLLVRLTNRDSPLRAFFGWAPALRALAVSGRVVMEGVKVPCVRCRSCCLSLAMDHVHAMDQTSNLSAGLRSAAKLGGERWSRWPRRSTSTRQRHAYVPPTCLVRASCVPAWDAGLSLHLAHPHRPTQLGCKCTAAFKHPALGPYMYQTTNDTNTDFYACAPACKLSTATICSDTKRHLSCIPPLLYSVRPAYHTLHHITWYVALHLAFCTLRAPLPLWHAADSAPAPNQEETGLAGLASSSIESLWAVCSLLLLLLLLLPLPLLLLVEVLGPRVKTDKGREKAIAEPTTRDTIGEI